MTRAEKIEFVKQQTELAKKVALRPHLAESDVLAAILELDNKVTLIRYHISQNTVFSRRSRRRLRKRQLQQMTLFCKIIQSSSFIRYPRNAEPSSWKSSCRIRQFYTLKHSTQSAIYSTHTKKLCRWLIATRLSPVLL